MTIDFRYYSEKKSLYKRSTFTNYRDVSLKIQFLQFWHRQEEGGVTFELYFLTKMFH